MFSGLLEGAGLALLVACPPGATSALCLANAREGFKQAMHVILAAALVNGCCAALSEAGLYALAPAGELLGWLTVAALILTAAFLWPRPRHRVSARAAVLLVVANPATASIWIALSATVRSLAHPPRRGWCSCRSAPCLPAPGGSVCSRPPPRS